MKDTQKASVVALVKRMLNKDQENKMRCLRIESGVLHNSAIGPADPTCVIPQLSEGTASYERIGDRIKPKSLVVRGVISIAPEQPADNRVLYVRLLILAQKNLKSANQVNTPGQIAINQLLRPNVGLGNAETPYSGITHNAYDPINRDLFRVYMDKVVKLCPVDQTTSTETRSPTAFTFTYRFKDLPSYLTFDEANGTFCNNFAPFFALGYSYADSSAPDVVQTRVVSTVSSYLTFEDA